MIPADALPSSLPLAQKFCSMCGAPSPTEGFVCAPCAGRIDRSAAAGSAPRAASLGGALALYFSLLAVCIGVTVVGSQMAASATAKEYVRLDALGSGVLSAVVLVFCFARWGDIRPALLKLGSRTWYAVAALSGIATFSLASTLMDFLHARFGVQIYDMSSCYRDAGSPIWLPILTIAVQPAVFEELAFRGFIDGALRKTLGPIESLVLTAFMFVFLHLSPLAAIHLIILALAIGIIRRRSGSLYPCMLMHFVHNGLVLGHEMIFGGTP